MAILIIILLLMLIALRSVGCAIIWSIDVTDKKDKQEETQLEGVAPSAPNGDGKASPSPKPTPAESSAGQPKKE